MAYKMEWVDAEIQHAYQDIIIYKTYSDDDYSEPYSYWFSLYEDNMEDSDTNFDIREFETYDDFQSVNRNLEHAILAKLITKDGWKYKMSDKIYIKE
jgi:hypothetical protein